MNSRPRARSPELSLSSKEIAAGAAALGLALDESAAGKLAEFGRLLARWNAVHNLTAIRSSDEVLTHHLLDSLALVPQVLKFSGGRAARVLDVGAGGGLPGIPLAIARPEIDVTMVDAVQKKVAFITQAQLELRLANARAVHSRVESLGLPPFDFISSRAFASLADFVSLTRALLAPEGRWLAMKGVFPHAEIAALPTGVEVQEVIELQVPGLSEARHLVVMRQAQAGR